MMEFRTIATVKSCYGEKFGIPRQPGIVDEAWGELIFEPGYRNPDAIRGLEGFTHVWLVFVFHQAVMEEGSDWKPLVRPPRLGGNQKVGVFASRSPFRPNPIGLSCVRLEKIDTDHPDGPVLHLRGVDLVDGTPVLDIKPYIPFSDSLPDAHGGFAHDVPATLEVHWAENTREALDQQTRDLVTSTLATDPRPAYQNTVDGREYGCLINGWNIRWVITDDGVLVTSCDAAG